MDTAFVYSSFRLNVFVTSKRLNQSKQPENNNVCKENNGYGKRISEDAFYSQPIEKLQNQQESNVQIHNLTHCGSFARGSNRSRKNLNEDPHKTGKQSSNSFCTKERLKYVHVSKSPFQFVNFKEIIYKFI